LPKQAAPSDISIAERDLERERERERKRKIHGNWRKEDIMVMMQMQ
jgi:hypothetical protein